MIQWKNIGSKKIAEPVKGLDETFDKANSRMDEIKTKLSDYLLEVQKEMKNKSIKYTTLSKRWRYELDIETDMAKKVPDHYISTSSTTRNKRF